MFSAKQGLLEWGFQGKEIKNLESKIGLTDFGKEEVASIERFAKDENKKTLIFLFFRGTECRYSSFGSPVETKGLVSFVRGCANIPRVYVMALFDCCYHEFANSEDLSTKLTEASNISCVYREEGSCKNVRDNNMAEQFFAHLKSQRTSRQDGQTLIPNDLITFNPKVKPFFKGWAQVLANPQDSKKQSSAPKLDATQ